MTAQTETLNETRVAVDVLGVIENRGDAMAAARELMRVGFHAADLKFLRGGDLVHLIEPEPEHCDLLLHAAHALWSHLAEDVADKRVGPYVVAAHTHSPGQVDQVLAILKANAAKQIEVVPHRSR